MLAARSGARKTGGVRRWQGAHAGHGCLGVWRAVSPPRGRPTKQLAHLSSRPDPLVVTLWPHPFRAPRCVLVRSLFPAETDDPTPFTALTPRGSTPSWRRWFTVVCFIEGGEEHGCTVQEQIVLSPIAHQLRYRSSTAASSMCEDSRGTQRNQRSQALALLQVVAAARRTGRWYVRAPDRNEGETPLCRVAVGPRQ